MTSLGQIWDQILPEIQELHTYKKFQHIFEELETEIYLKDTSEESIVYNKLKSLSKPLCSKNLKEEHLSIIQIIELIIKNVKLYSDGYTIFVKDDDINIPTIFGTSTQELHKPNLSKSILKIFEEYHKDGDLNTFLNTKLSKTRNIGIWCNEPKGLTINRINSSDSLVETHSILIEPYNKKYFILNAPVMVKDILSCIYYLNINTETVEIDCAKINETSMALEIFN
jgi:hypothetical protein